MSIKQENRIKELENRGMMIDYESYSVAVIGESGIEFIDIDEYFADLERQEALECLECQGYMVDYKDQSVAAVCEEGIEYVGVENFYDEYHLAGLMEEYDE